MKVLMFGWEFPPFNSGGLGVACRGLTRALAFQQVDVTFVLPKPVQVPDTYMRFVFAQHVAPDQAESTESYGEGVRFREVDALLSPYLTSEEYERILEEQRQLGILGLGPIPLYGPDLYSEVQRYALEAARIAREEEFDVIHAHDWLAFPAGMAAKYATGKPLVLHVHLPAVDQTGGNGYDQRIFDVEQQAFQAADTIIAISQRVKDSIVSQHHISPAKIEVVHNGMDSEDVAEEGTRVATHPLRRAGNPFALFLGRLTMFKGPDKFLEAAALAAKVYPEARFVVAGTGEAEARLKYLANELGLAEKVHFAGFVRGAEKDALFANANVFVMPSLSEPFGLVALESQALGAPIIVSKQSGASEVLKHALKVDFWDIEELAQKMIAVMKYPSLARQLRSHGATEARSLTWEKPARECVGLYQRLTALAA